MLSQIFTSWNQMVSCLRELQGPSRHARSTRWCPTANAQDRDGHITAFIEVENVKALHAEYVTAGAMFDQKLRKQAWGGRDFIVRDLDGNGICFVGPAA